jgi:para-aminobenzoate synthetase/4-amino-4-deoxychorismate lyase
MNADPQPGRAALQRTDAQGLARWVHFPDADTVLEAWTLAEVAPVLEAAQTAARRGWNAVGWIAYEAAPAFDPHLRTHAPYPGLPLARFSLHAAEHAGLPAVAEGSFACDEWQAAWDADSFAAKVARVKEAIAAGETYQVNLCYPWQARFQGSAWALFRSLRLGQQARHQAYFDEGDRVIASASPELFFALRDGRVTCRPMKGTSAPSDPAGLLSAKNRAENLMIVDMIRNDLGKLAVPGSVEVPALFRRERYPSLWQLTSTVQARGGAPAAEWLRALFPCASITGAPKRQTMSWIHALEDGPRGVYTGAMGGFYADGSAEFNVAIRTAVIDRRAGRLRYHSGCGIVWDSDAAAEYRESQLKTRIIREPTPDFRLIETLRWTPAEGAAHWSWHRQRLLDSAQALGFAVLPESLDASFLETTGALREPTRLRLLADLDGGLAWSATPLPATRAWTFALDTRPSPSEHPEFDHKTTRRSLYDRARARHPETDEVLLVNERGELMEFTHGNLVLDIGGQAWTPALASGLLNGTTRRRELAAGRILERVLGPDDLAAAERVYLLNAVRGWLPMRQAGATA